MPPDYRPSRAALSRDELLLFTNEARSLPLDQWQVQDWLEPGTNHFVLWVDHVRIAPFAEVFAEQGRWCWRVNVPEGMGDQRNFEGQPTKGAANTITAAKRLAYQSLTGMIQRNLSPDETERLLQARNRQRLEQFRANLASALDRLNDALDEPLEPEHTPADGAWEPAS